jgi:hypothetical protein
VRAFVLHESFILQGRGFCTQKDRRTRRNRRRQNLTTDDTDQEETAKMAGIESHEETIVSLQAVAARPAAE